MVLSTCNRTEIYVVPAMHEVTGEYLKDYIICQRYGQIKSAHANGVMQGTVIDNMGNRFRGNAGIVLLKRVDHETDMIIIANA